MAFGDTEDDEALRAAWHEFCDRLKAAGDLAFKDTSPANGLQRADAFRYLTQNLGQAYDLALETKNTRFPVIHPFCGPSRKLGGDNADFVYLQAWIDGASTYKISGNRGTARFINFTVQGPRPDTDVYYGADHPNLHEPFGDTPEANITGDDLATEPDASFVLYVGGERREPNWLPTTPGSRKLFMRQGFDSWEERSAQFSIERIDMDMPRPVPTPQDLIASMQWAGDFLTGVMTDWPDRELQIGSLFGEPEPNVFPGARFSGEAEQRDARRGRLIVTMPWRLASDEALIFEFADDGEFWMLTNMGAFWNSMDYLYRPVSYTPSRSAIDSDGRVRLVMAHDDPGVHNWIDTQRFTEGYLTMRVIGSRQLPDVRTRVVPLAEVDTVLPADTQRVTPEERAAQLHARFDAIRRRYRI
jgi:hypothetical protein